MVLGDLKLHPDGAIELGPHRFASPDQVQLAEYFDTRIRPAPDHGQDMVVEHEEEAYVFRFQPAQRQWRRESLSREQLQAWTPAQRQFPVSLPQELPTNSPATSVNSTPSRFVLDETRSKEKVSARLKLSRLPVIRSQWGVKSGKGSGFLSFHEPRRFVVKGRQGGIEPAQVAETFVGTVAQAIPPIEIGWADYGKPGSVGECAPHSLVLRCTRPLSRPALAIVDTTLQRQGRDLVITVLQYEYSPKWTFFKLLLSAIMLAAVLFGSISWLPVPGPSWPSAIRRIVNGAEIALAAAAIGCGIATWAYPRLSGQTISNQSFWRELRPDEERKAEALLVQVLSSLEDSVPEGFSMTPFTST